eukprot:Selendium_serpulae@DN4027_c0_g1_i1.p2
MCEESVRARLRTHRRRVGRRAGGSVCDVEDRVERRDYDIFIGPPGRRLAQRQLLHPHLVPRVGEFDSFASSRLAVSATLRDRRLLRDAALLLHWLQEVEEQGKDGEVLCDPSILHDFWEAAVVVDLPTYERTNSLAAPSISDQSTEEDSSVPVQPA